MSEHHSTPLRGAVVGLGVMGGHHARVLDSLPHAELTAIVDQDVERLGQIGRSFPRASPHRSLEQALAASELDFAVIAVPVEQLPVMARQALAAGLHVLVEKPTAPTEDEAIALALEAERRGLTLAVGHVERFNPAVALLKEKLETGMAGRILQARARRLSPFPNRASMHGVALDLATHDIDVMRYLIGSDIVRVYAETEQHVHDRGEDLLCATLRFEDGTTGLLEVNWVTPTKVRDLAVTGERGMFTLDYLTQELCFYEHPTSATEWDTLASIRGGGEGDMIRYAFERREPLRVEWESFLTAVCAGSAAPVTALDGAAALATARAICHAGQAHEVVVPSYPPAVVA
jgi:UDP-N-acetylglucosamine 3-dehydrogenase